MTNWRIRQFHSLDLDGVIGLPDRQVREAMWQRFIPTPVVDAVDVELLVERTQGFSPGDIEYAARASQRALEKAVCDDGGLASGGTVSVREAVRKGPSTQGLPRRHRRNPDHHQRRSPPRLPEDTDALGCVYLEQTAE
ncbi:hypothetical protein ABIE00_002597 [Arthrobacter sp. OAP107]